MEVNKNYLIKPKNDIIFTNLFSKKGNEHLFLSFLNSILEKEIGTIEVLKEVELTEIFHLDKCVKLDLKALTSEEDTICMEIQLVNKHNTKERFLYYGAKELTLSLGKGQEYINLKNTILIGILDYNIYEDEEYKRRIHNVETINGTETFENLQFYIIELPKFRKIARENIDKEEIQWLAFLDYEDKEVLEMAKARNANVKQAVEEYEYLVGEAAIRRKAELIEKWERDYKSGMNATKRMAAAEGRAEGLAEGRAEGMQQEKFEIAKKLKQKGYDIQEICLITNLEKQKVESLA